MKIKQLLSGISQGIHAFEQILLIQMVEKIQKSNLIGKEVQVYLEEERPKTGILKAIDFENECIILVVKVAPLVSSDLVENEDSEISISLHDIANVKLYCAESDFPPFLTTSPFIGKKVMVRHFTEEYIGEFVSDSNEGFFIKKANGGIMYLRGELAITIL